MLNWFSSATKVSQSTRKMSRRAARGGLRFESLEERTVLATDIAFNAVSGVLTLTVGEALAAETVDLSVTGTTLSIESDQGITVDAGAALLGFTAEGPNLVSDGSLALVTQINIVGDGGVILGPETVNINGGTFAALNIAGSVDNVAFAVAPSIFSNVSGNLLANADLSVTAGVSLTQSAAATISTTGGGDISLTTQAGDIDVNAAITASANGNVEISADDNVNLDAAVTASGAGTVGITAGGDGSGTFTSSAAGIVSSASGDIEILAPNLLTLGGAVSTTVAGNISLTSSLDDVLVNAALSAAGAGSITINADNDDFGFGDVITTATIATAGGDVTITAQDIDLGATVNVGIAAGSDVNLRPRTDGTEINLGTDVGFGITDADLDLITASTIRVGTALAGKISVNTAIDSAANATLSLLTDAGVAQKAGATLTVNSLAISADENVKLSELNNVINLAIATTDVGADVEFTDSNGFNIDTRDGVVGISTEATGSVSLTAGGAVTQSALANVFSGELELLGTGSFDLSNDGNNVVTLAANLTTATTGTLTYRDANELKIGLAAGTSGITTNDSAVTVSTVNGNLTVLNGNAGVAADITAGTGAVSLTAGATAGTDTTLAINADAGVSATGGVTLVGDDLSIAAAVDAGVAGTVNVSPFEAGTQINLGAAADVAANATIELSDAELDFITAGNLVIGDAASGNLSITAAIAAGLTGQLELATGGAIIDANAIGIDITATRLALSASTGIGVGASLETSVSNIEAVTATGGIEVDNTLAGTLTIGGVSATLGGVDVTTSGDITLTNDAGIEIDLAGENVQGTANIDITAGLGAGFGAFDILTGGNQDAVISTGVGSTVSLTADQDLLLGDVGLNVSGSVQGGGSVALEAGRDIVIDAGTTVDATGTGTISAEAGTAGLGGDISVLGTVTAGARLSSEGGSITLTTGADGVLTLDSGAVSIDSTLTGAGDGNVVINADDVVIDAGASLTSGTGIATLQQGSATLQDVNLGTNVAGSLSLTDAELDLITAATLRVGRTDNAGNITVSAAVSPALATTLHLLTGGAILDGTVTETADITVANLALEAAAGIGSADDLNVAVTTLAAANTTTGNIRVSDSADLTIGTVDLVEGAVNTAVAGTIDIVAGTALTVASDVTSVADVDLSAGSTVAAGDDLTVNAGATVQSTAADVTLEAGDLVFVPLGATVQAAGTATLTGGLGEVDGGGGVTLQGDIAGTTVNVSGDAGADVFILNPASGPALISVLGQDGDDTFTVTPVAGTAFSIDGGNPLIPAVPGDTLNLDSAGATGLTLIPGVPGAGTFTFTNRDQISFTGIDTLAALFDFGDLPDTVLGTSVNNYNTLLLDDGPRHAIGGGLFLGTGVDAELDGIPSILADGDDLLNLDDDDGVQFTTSLIAGQSATAQVNASAAGRVDAFIDFNNDGDFLDAGERITPVGGTVVAAGDTNINFNVPGDAVAGAHFTRFRISTAGGLDSTGAALDGEVEDGVVSILVTTAGTAVLVPDPLVPGQNTLLVTGNAGNDRIIFDLVNRGTQIRARVIQPGPDVNLVFDVNTVNKLVAFGGDGNDSIKVSSRIFLTAELHGGAGKDRLYGGSGDDLLRGGIDNDLLYGGKGDDVLLGEDGNDKLLGQTGFDILIGGTGADYLSGSLGENILIGGTTTLDANATALLQIMAAWKRNMGSFQQRTDALSAVLHDAPLATVIDDAAVDRLISSSISSDWFLDFALADRRNARGSDRVN